MNKLNSSKIFLLSFLLLNLFILCTFSQSKPPTIVEVKTVSEEDLIPSVVKNLPNWEKVRDRSVYIKNIDELKKEFGERAVLSVADFTGGTDAATAQYDEGKLLIIDYYTPQAAVEGDANFTNFLARNPQPNTFYRRTGNYSVFVFDAKDEISANALLDQVKYSKTVQWLGRNPHILRRAEAAFAKTTGEIFLSTFLWIALSLGGTILLGAIAGIIVFYRRKKQRASMTKFSDAGGMVRLNLDELTELPVVGLLKK